VLDGTFDAADGRGRRVVDAALLRRCCTVDAAGVDPRGLRLRGVHVRGRLDLTGVDVAFALVFDDCVFDDALVLEDASVRSLVVTGSPSLPGLLGNGLRVRGDLDLSRSLIAGAHRTPGSTTKRAAVWLCEAQIGGRVLCVDTVITADGERAIQADRLRVGGNVRFLHGFTATGEVRMLGVRVGGSLDLTGARLDRHALAADGVEQRNSLDQHNSLDQRNGRVQRDGPALDLSEADIGGSLFIVPHPATARVPVVHGRIDLPNARIAGRILIRDAVLDGCDCGSGDEPCTRTGGPGTAIHAYRLAIGGDLMFAGACRVRGGLDLSLSDLGTVAFDGGCRLIAPGRCAVDLASAEVRSNLTIAPGVIIEGAVRIAAAHIGGTVSLQRVTLRSPLPHGALISAHGVVVDGPVELQHLTADGGFLGFRDARIGSFFDATGATLTNPGERTIGLRQAVVKSSVRLTEGFHSTGFVMLNRCVIEGRLDLRGGRFECPEPSAENPAGHAIQAVSATVRAGLYLGWREIGPSVDFTDLATTVLADDPSRWPARFVISGMRYDRFGQPSHHDGARTVWDCQQRLHWLRGHAGYDADPYEQLARVFRQHGYLDDAEAILIERRHQARRANRARRQLPRRALDALYGWVVGYGYRPGRTVWLLLALIVAVAASLYLPAIRSTMRATDSQGNTYAVDGRLVTVSQTDPARASATTADQADLSTQQPRADPCGNGQIRCFDPVLYAIDTVVPLISLGQRSTWYANPHAPHGTLAQWWLNLATLAGWLLSTVFLLSFTRFFRAM
jgi:hypothetical protein